MTIRIIRSPLIAFVFTGVLLAPLWSWPFYPVTGRFPEFRGERWCAVHNPGLGDIQWNCFYPTQALCVASVGPSSDFCFRNPNWGIPVRRWHW
jgi:hypothetical protein